MKRFFYCYGRKLFFIALLFPSFYVTAQFPYSETFKNTTAPGIVISGSSKLTAAAGIDAAGQGYLRLNENVVNSVGYAYGVDSFPSNYGLTVSFEFFCYKPGATSTNQADGMTFFLFDAAVNAFRPGGSGGSLGYAQYYNTPGMAKGYMGISIDEFGNFSSATDGTKNGGPGQRRGSVAIRGPGNGKAVTDYVYQTGVTASDAPYNAGFAAFTQRYPDSTNANYRRLKVILTPGSVLGATLGYKITVIMYKGGTPVTPVTLISNYDYPFIAPPFLQFGLAASTGSITNYHEIRNLTIDATSAQSLVVPSLFNDIGISTCLGTTALIDVTANDLSLNTGGLINKKTVDLDPVTAGIQTSFTDAGKGTYTVDSVGIVTFTPISTFSGTSSAYYRVSDTYGLSAAASAMITVTVNNSAAPLLTLNTPSAVCSPSLVNITNAAYKQTTSPGATYHYFNSLTDANANLNNIDLTASVVNKSGIYYVRASLNGCATIQPMVVEVNTPPSTSNAGSDITYCSSTGGQSATLLATNPDIGIGVWTQVSGPAAANIVYPGAATCPVNNMAKGVYLFRWTMVNGVCAASVDDVQVSVGVTSNAGNAQSIANATSVKLAGNTVAPAIGLWSLVSGTPVSFSNTADSAATVSGLVPGNSYVFSWRVTNGGCTSTTQVTVNNVLNTIANAGVDETQNTFQALNLKGNTPDAGNTGAWTLVSAPVGSSASITAAALPVTTVTAINRTGDYTFRWTISNGSFSNSDDVTFRVSSTLPVNWLSFKGHITDDGVLLEWKTAQEQNNDHFDVERSTDGIHFQHAGRVAGAGTVQTVSSYQYKDIPGSIDASHLFYRLKQVDLDGKSSYSEIVMITLPTNTACSVYPNPAIDYVTIRAMFNTTGKASVRIYDAAARMVYQSQYATKKGINYITVGNLQRLAAGIVYLEITDGNTQYRQTIWKK